MTTWTPTPPPPTTGVFESYIYDADVFDTTGWNAAIDDGAPTWTPQSGASVTWT